MTDIAVDRAVHGWIRDKLLLGRSPRQYLRELITPFNVIAALILASAAPIVVYRFAAGLGATTNLSQTNPWGLWIGFDVLCGVALAAGGYTLAATVIIFGLKEYTPVLRPALLTGFLGYFFVVVGLVVDLGQPWHLPYPVFYSFGVTSVMFEVAWCVFLYLMVLALEFSPACFEWLGWSRARRLAVGLTLGLTVFGVVLSTLHQSSLGALFLMAPTKLHPLWYSQFIPVFFFVSSVAGGLSMVIIEGALSHRLLSDRVEPGRESQLDRITLGLGKAASIVLFTYFFLKVLGVADGGRWDLLGSGLGRWYLVEILGFVLLPCMLFAHAARSRSAGLARVAAVITVLGIIVNRFNVSLVAMNWSAAVRYVPSWMEILVSVGIVTFGVLTFRWIVNRMPVLREHPEYRGAH
jgi:Ni/Fe-hydrogenase subunit HybB-like protein